MWAVRHPLEGRLQESSAFSLVCRYVRCSAESPVGVPWMTSPRNVIESSNRTTQVCAIGTFLFPGQFEVEMWVSLYIGESGTVYLSLRNTGKQELLRSLWRMARNCHLGQDLPTAHAVSLSSQLLSEIGPAPGACWAVFESQQMQCLWPRSQC